MVAVPANWGGTPPFWVFVSSRPNSARSHGVKCSAFLPSLDSCVWGSAIILGTHD